jgi:nitrogen regulatory protein P-II 1
MKRVECIIRPSRLVDLKNSLAALGVNGMTVIEAGGFGRQRGFTGMYSGDDYQVDLVPKLIVIVVVHDTMVDRVLDSVREKCYTGEVGDGKVFVYPVEQAMRIRTGDKGENAV